jgi:hypothetical protein
MLKVILRGVLILGALALIYGLVLAVNVAFITAVVLGTVNLVMRIYGWVF